jgi:hypothetical protein
MTVLLDQFCRFAGFAGIAIFKKKKSFMTKVSEVEEK